MRAHEAAVAEPVAGAMMVRPERVSSTGPETVSKENRSEGRRLERQYQVVARAKEEWEAAVDAVSDLVFLTDHEGHVLRCNRAARDALGRTFDGILGLSLEELLHSELHCGDFRSDSEAGELETGEDGRVLEYSRFPAACDGRSLGNAFVFRDVTELRRLQGIAARVDMMNNLGQVLSSVRHEIGNPTNAMKTALTVMKESLHEFSEEKLLSYIDRCLDDVQRIQGLLEQLRTLHLFEVSRREQIDLRRFLLEILPAVREGLEARGIDLECALSEDPHFEVTGDSRALYQVLLGLIANASEALGDRPRPRLVRLALGSWHGFVGLTVADNGPGIEPELFDKVILPLFTTKPGGTGLGLAIAHKMVTRMGGLLTIGNDAELGGARVTVHLRVPAAPRAS